MTHNNMPLDASFPNPSVFPAGTAAGDAYYELKDLAGSPRSQWHLLVESFEALGLKGLHDRQLRAERMRHEDGATFNPFDDIEERTSVWNLDLVPLLVQADEWQTIEAGVKQRARLLECVLADTYGPQDLLRDGSLPPEAYFANPSFLRQSHNIVPAGGRFLPFYAVDLYRDRTGCFRVWRDHGSHPAGLGYALENRIVLSRVHADLYQRSQICRLAPFFQVMHRGLVDRAALKASDPGIVLLSPGPDSPFYFEQALLSRYLGYPLVESEDLTVRNGEVFLKKLAGLDKVSVVIRHVPDVQSDPFALRRATSQGVAGLMQAAREGRVELVNPIGCGFIETPLLAPLLPELCRRVIGEELALDGHRSWWCGRDSDRQHVLDHYRDVVISPALQTGGAGDQDYRELIAAKPYAYVAREPLHTSLTPAWSLSGIADVSVMLRLFVCAVDSTDFAVLPGGLAMTARDPAILAGDRADEQSSKDIWVVSASPVEPVSLLDGLEQPQEFRRSSDLPSRVADNLLWLGRYLERAEGRVRLIRSVYRRLLGESAPRDIGELPFLLMLLSAQEVLPDSGPEGELPPLRDLLLRLHDALFAKTTEGGIVNIILRVQETARKVRDRLSMDCWRVINRLDDYFDGYTADPLDLLEETLFTLNCFSGVAMESMTRGFGWRFMDMGRRVERAMNQIEVLQAGLQHGGLAVKSNLEALLEIADSVMTYRSRYRTTIQLAPVLDLLLADESNPKSLAFQINSLAAHVDNLPRPTERRFSTIEERIVLEMLTSVRLLTLHEQQPVEAADEVPAVLPGFLETTLSKLNEFARQVSAHYLTRVPTTPHYSMMHEPEDHDLSR